jgi:CRP/FNR family transcriptional regulator, cyclic AMP receptor protein
MSKSSLAAYLSECAFFSGLAPEHMAFLAEHASTRSVRTDEVLFRHGEPAKYFYLVTNGHVTVEVPAIEGPALELQDLGPRDVVGWSWAIAPHKWAFQARAKTPVDVWQFDGEAVLAHCEEDPTFGYELLKRFSALMSERLRFARERMMEEWQAPGMP